MFRNKNLKPDPAHSPYQSSLFMAGLVPHKTCSPEKRSLTPLFSRDIKKKGQKWSLIARSFDFFRELTTGLIFVRRKAQIENHMANQIHFGIG